MPLYAAVAAKAELPGPVKLQSDGADPVDPGQDSGPVLPRPKIYGSLKVPRDVTLCSMAGTVYGRFNQQILESILRANPDIQNPDLIRSGMSIAFPVAEPGVELGVDGAGPGWTRDVVCLLFSRHVDFRAAYDKARALKAKDVDARVFPVRTPDRGFVFLVILDQPFVTMAAAQAFKRQVPTLADSRCTGLFPGGINETLP